MKKAYWMLILLNGALFFIVGASTTYYLFKNETAIDVPVLDIIVGINTILVTIAIALAAYKVVTAKNVKEAVEEEMGSIELKNKKQFDSIKEKLEEMDRDKSQILANSLETLIIVVQEMAEKIQTQQGLSKQAPAISKSVTFASELTKEIIVGLHMFILTASPDAAIRLRGYQLLDTLDIDQVKEYFRIKIREEENKRNIEYLSNII